jgi:signal transduction histidine kinase
MRSLRNRVGVGPRAELALALAFVAAAFVEQRARRDAEHSTLPYVWIAAVGLPLFVRRTHPVAGTIFAAALIAAAPETSGSFPPSLFEYVLPVVLAYACGAHSATGPGLAATVALIVGIQIHLGFADAPNGEIAIATLPPWWAGREVRRRRQLVRELAERTRELETEEEAFVRLSVQRERARIARDLHDIVSHHVALMVIQAGAGRLAEPWNADAAASRLATIRDAGAQALTEADRLVSMLHPVGAQHARLSPLLDRARELGAHVLVTPRDMILAGDLEVLAHHVVREAITNAMKHAPGAKLDIRLALDGTALTIAVHNTHVATTSPIAATGSGLGLAGMRERVATAGGSLHVHSDSDGFQLRATLPRHAETTVAAAAEEGLRQVSTAAPDHRAVGGEAAGPGLPRGR